VAFAAAVGLIPTMADGVLLDWEGVLADTADARRDALLRALADEGIDSSRESYYERCPGRSVRAAAAAMLGSRASDAALVEIVAVRAERAFAAELARGFAVDPSAARFTELAQLRAPLVVVTAAARAETDVALRLAGLHDSCAAIVTADDVIGEAPSRESYELGMARINRRRPVKREHVVVLGDTVPALRAARSAGLRTLAVNAPAHVALEADAAVASLTGLTLDSIDALLDITAERPA
jgi:beta-phosphoglucomutase-like phosphatase (HAD superfamily)